MDKLDAEIKQQKAEQKKLIKKAKEQKEYKKYLQRLSGYYVIFAGLCRADKFDLNADKESLAKHRATKWTTGSYKGYKYEYYLNTPKFLKENKNRYVPSDAMFPDQSGEVKFDDVNPYFDSRALTNVNTAMEVTRIDDFLFTKSEALNFIKKAKYPKIMKHEIIPAKYAHPDSMFLSDF